MAPSKLNSSMASLALAVLEGGAARGSLERLGCDYGQGYLFAKPLPAQEAEVMIAGRETL